MWRWALIGCAGFVWVCGAIGLEAGAAKVEITPAPGTPLNGYFGRLGRGAVGVRDPLWARCLYLSDKQTHVALVNADLCLINRELRDRVLELAPDFLDKKNIILTATHTHNGTGGLIRAIPARFVSGRFAPDVLEQTAQAIAEAVRKASTDSRRAVMGYATLTQNDLTENRRVSSGPIDPQIGVIRVEDSDGNPIALVANLAAHPTTVGGTDTYSFSADYPGYFYAEAERLAGGECVAMFLNGAEGNQRAANPEQRHGLAQTESIGRLLAARVVEAANTITCGEVSLRVGYATPTLPRTVAPAVFPQSTVLHTLEIDNLLLTFFPGEPCVEIGLEMRRRALALGYAAQFSVGLADDHLLYFVPRELYPTRTYESEMNVYGPLIAEWFYEQFSLLMSKSKPVETPLDRPEAVVRKLDGGSSVQLAGTLYEIGYARGSAFREELHAALDRSIVGPARDGTLSVPDTLFRLTPGFVDRAPLALFRLGTRVRPTLASLASSVVDELAGVADGAELPFDAVWLAQFASALSPQSSVDAVRPAPMSTMMALAGDRAGADDILVGCNFDWGGDERPVVFEISPETGHRYTIMGLGWLTGLFAGMNEHGLVVAVERSVRLGEPTLEAAPLEMLAREALSQTSDAQSAKARFEASSGQRGYNVLVADANAQACVIELGETITTRIPQNGILTGMDPPSAEPADGIRYARAASLVAAERILDVPELTNVLSDVEPGRAGRQRILNEETRCRIVFEPRSRRMHVSFAQSPGVMGRPVTYTVE